MKYISTADEKVSVSFRDAILNNLPNDGGLYFPSKIPKLEESLLEAIPEMKLHEIAANVLSKFVGDDIDGNALDEMVKRVFDFPIPLKDVTNGISCIELFHGPTYAFKDVGAKFLAECLAHFNASENTEKTVLVATSGDTGGAVANGFLGVDGVRVIILYPKGKVSLLQEKQLTTLGQNITALEIEGNFDDCQDMVKQAFADKELNRTLDLSSANSINVGRWLPQSLFYYVPLQHGFHNEFISVPSGNYGNLTAGVLAMLMGVPIKGFVAASNANDVVPRYLSSGVYEPQSTIPTVANAMDVSDPSNFKRLMSLFSNDYNSVRAKLHPFSIDDDRIYDVIRSCNEETNYLLDPHSAIAYDALKSNDKKGIFLGTAHYCKFLPALEKALSQNMKHPDFVKELMLKEKVSIPMSANYDSFKELLLS